MEPVVTQAIDIPLLPHVYVLNNPLIYNLNTHCAFKVATSFTRTAFACFSVIQGSFFASNPPVYTIIIKPTQT
jgi:hypothetical protein